MTAVRTGLTLRFLARNARALVLGAAVGVLLVAAYKFIDASIAERAAAAEGSQLLMPVNAQVQFAALYAIYAAAIIVVVCVPIWALLERLRFANLFASAGLGFVVTLAFWIISNLSPITSPWELASSGLPWALSGAVAGMATWWARPQSINRNPAS